MSDAWVLILVLIVTTALVRASGPVLLGGRELPPRALSVVALVAPALLAGLVMTETFRAEGGSDLTIDARALGVASAGGVLLLRGPLLLALAVAMGVTAGARAIG